jgi:4-hydroxybenzoate polyprenyltransferase
MAVRLLDGLAFSSLLASAIGAGLSLVASRALLAPDAGRSALLASSGAFLIYTLDRLRDADRDRHTSPARTRFVQRHRRSLLTALVVAGLLFGAAWLTASPAIQGLCAGIGVVGLLHRRLKTHPVLKTGYVSLAWVAGCVGIPWIAAGRPGEGLWLAGSLLAVLVANLIASNLRDRETHPLPARPDTVLSIAFAAVAVAMTVALLAPGRAVVAGWIALLECLALAGFRADERYGLIVVDGALLVGSLLAWIQLGLLSGS